MTKLRLLLALALAVVLALPAGAVLAQQEADGTAAPAATAAADDPRLAEMAALVPSALAGLPLDQNLQLATGEEIVGVMEPEEAAILADMLAANGKTTADYAAAATWLPVTETRVVPIQAHRVAGIEASQTIDAWVRILSMHVTEPDVSEGFISGRPVRLISDAANKDAPLLQMFSAGDMVWMIWSDDQALVEEAMDQVGADEAPADERAEEEG